MTMVVKIPQNDLRGQNFFRSYSKFSKWKKVSNGYWIWVLSILRLFLCEFDFKKQPSLSKNNKKKTTNDLIATIS